MESVKKQKRQNRKRNELKKLIEKVGKSKMEGISGMHILLTLFYWFLAIGFRVDSNAVWLRRIGSRSK